ncbi:unnamed protein product [Angiostrongylus costaricensis]|uniref:Ovule protein n=1 Tax=Angiostrongylus costaricensis TaxID=334426 RepID=A0A0R3PP48_ANGCS|nr:unnamed protein product [Angiostrongylus costaricensis]
MSGNDSSLKIEEKKSTWLQLQPFCHSHEVHHGNVMYSDGVGEQRLLFIGLQPRLVVGCERTSKAVIG